MAFISSGTRKIIFEEAFKHCQNVHTTESVFLELYHDHATVPLVHYFEEFNKL